MKKFFCRNGHALTEENTREYTRKNGYIQKDCMVCVRVSIERANSSDKAKVRKKKYYESHKEQKKEYYLKNKERFSAQRKEYYLKTKPYLKRYGIGIEEYDRMLALQDHRCRICGKHESEVKAALAVDHCHKTGVVRALLCSTCNIGIGNLEDSIDLLRKAIEYLDDFRELEEIDADA